VGTRAGDRPTTVLVVHDRDDRRWELFGGLMSSASVAVVAHVAGHEDAIGRARLWKPDVAVVELQLRRVSGPEVIGGLRVAYPDMGIVAVGRADAEATAYAGVRMGAQAFVPHDQISRLPRAVESVAEGETLLTPALARRVRDELESVAARSHPLAPYPTLTRVEDRVLGLVAGGDTPDAIAMRLGVTERLVNEHLRHAVTKLSRFVTTAAEVDEEPRA
jgi:DNA-binding NarL/FixJ family response regulator